MNEIKYQDLSPNDQALLDSAEKALAQAYNPYNSQTRVGAAVRTVAGEIVVGSSMANASSTANLCAERVAFASANSLGHRDIETLAIIGTDSDGVVEVPVTPCGTCRQFMSEFLTINGGDLNIICSNSAKDKIIKTTLKVLLPLPYSNSNSI